MFEILAAAAAETAIQSPSTVQTYGPAVALLIAMGGWKGIAQGVLWLQGKSGNEKANGRYVPQVECALRHEKDAQMNASLVKSMDKLEQAVTRLHDRIDHVTDMHKE